MGRTIVKPVRFRDESPEDLTPKPKRARKRRHACTLAIPRPRAPQQYTNGEPTRRPARRLPPLAADSVKPRTRRSTPASRSTASATGPRSSATRQCCEAAPGRASGTAMPCYAHRAQRRFLERGG
eukprot:7386192-Prymnesium_polylepis.1